MTLGVLKKPMQRCAKIVGMGGITHRTPNFLPKPTVIIGSLGNLLPVSKSWHRDHRFSINQGDLAACW